MLSKTMTTPPKFHLSNSTLIKWFGAALMLVQTLPQVNLAQWLHPASPATTLVAQDASVLFALLTVLFLVFSLSKPLLRYANRLEDGISPHMVSNIYFAVACVCCLFSILA
jgi:hypothetical protein